MVPHHEVDFGAALRQVNRVAELVLFGELADRLQQLRRRCLGERGGGEDADASLVLAVPRGEQIVDPLHALVAQLRREPRRLAARQAVGRHRSGARSRCRGSIRRRRSAVPIAPAPPPNARCRSTFSTIVVVPVRIASSAATLTISVFSSPWSRLAGRTARRAEFGNPKSSLKPRSSTAAMCAWQLISPGISALPRPS